MRGTLLAMSAAAALLTIQAAQAGVLNFDFSFNNVSGNVSGTVTGEIFGLTDNASGEAATDIQIYACPLGFTGLPSAPFDKPSFCS